MDLLVSVAEIGVEDVEYEHGEDDGCALEPVEERLVLCQVAVKAFAQLGDAEDAAGEDKDGGEREGDDEAAKGKGAAELVVLWIERVGVPVDLDVAVGAVGEVAGGDDEEKHDDDLEDETGDYDVGAELEGVWVGRGRGYASTSSLERECNDVAGDEEAWVCFGCDARVALAESEHDARYAEIDGGCVECWSD